MTSLFCCSNNHHCVNALRMIDKAGISVRFVLTSDKTVDHDLKKVCTELGAIIVFDSSDVKLRDIKYDLLISFAYQKLIPVYLLHNADFAINFHPAPLPDYKGRANTIQALLNGETEWGVTCHFLEESFDTGNIIEKRTFPVDNPDTITGKALGNVSWNYCLDMLESVLKRLLNGEIITGTPQVGVGKYFSMKDLQNVKEVHIEDGAESIRRKVNALWYPPFEGAYIKIDGVKFYLLTDTILSDLK